MSVMVIRPERGCDDIHALIDHVLSDGGTQSAFRVG